MNDQKRWWNKTIVVCAISLSFVVNSILFTWEATRRPADTRTVEQKEYENCVVFYSVQNVQECEKYRELAK